VRVVGKNGWLSSSSNGAAGSVTVESHFWLYFGMWVSAFLCKSRQLQQRTLYRLNYGPYIMPGVKTGDKNYLIQNRLSFYLNDAQIRQMDLKRDVFEQRDLIPDGMSTSVLVKTAVLEIVPKFLKTVSIAEMEKAEAAVTNKGA